MHRGIATFTLDYGKCPRWLFERMVKLGREISRVVVEQYGPEEYIKRLADPVWFQSLGTVLAFDWNASGLTTTLTAALKEALRGQETNWGIFVCGGKGKTSRKTPDQIKDWGTRLSLPDSSVDNLVYNSRMSAKVDSSLIQDNFQIYHHTFFFTRSGAWTVVQQGMNAKNQTARRYHWYSRNIQDLVQEPHSGIASQLFFPQVLNLTSAASAKNRDLSLKLVSDGFHALDNDIKIIRKHSSSLSKVLSIQYQNPNSSGHSTGSFDSSDGTSESLRMTGKVDQLTLLQLSDTEFHHHPVESENFWTSRYLDKILNILCETKPQTYQQLLSTRGVGPKTIRALSLVAEVIYGAKPSYQDPARYSFAHGGKDATPFAVDRPTYDHTIHTLRQVVSKSRLTYTDKNSALKRLY